ncbi:hypothetical protein EVAR_67506_1 [Eumeta japonica]|uniref:Uncharacterized protein n=1 Tax=Eumeta variegata TaxID=151549 RepID=A0A4C2A0K0_EUMVA|nr:hypothetical protein EVAR_67506_1 [Eumeta japonica]
MHVRLVYFSCFHGVTSYGISLWGNAAYIDRIFPTEKLGPFGRLTSGDPAYLIEILLDYINIRNSYRGLSMPHVRFRLHVQNLLLYKFLIEMKPIFGNCPVTGLSGSNFKSGRIPDKKRVSGRIPDFK